MTILNKKAEMIYPAMWETEEPRTLSIHEKINEIVASLGVVYTGIKNQTLLFEKDHQSSFSDQIIGKNIAERLLKSSEIHKNLQNITGISLKP